MQGTTFFGNDQVHRGPKSRNPLRLAPVKDKAVLLDFDGGRLSSDAGILILKEAANQIGIIPALSRAICDTRDQRYVKHSNDDLIAQRVYQIMAGYEDQNDANTLRDDAVLKMALGYDPLGDDSLASQPTLSRFENKPSKSDIYRMTQTLVDVFIASYAEPPATIVLDFDDTDHHLHGGQQLSLFNDYYGEYCYLPLHIYEGLSGRLICPILKQKVMKGTQALAILRRLVGKLREHWPDTLILFRGDSHFSYPEVMDYIDDQPLMHNATGLRSNKVLKEMTRPLAEKTQKIYDNQGDSWGVCKKKKVTRFYTIRYQAGSWSKARRVIVKIEVSSKGTNIRYVVTDFEEVDAKALYRDIYCARAAAELCIKDHKTYLKSDRSSCHRFAANHFRLLLHSVAYVIYDYLRREVLTHTELAKATMETMRTKLVKVAARVIQLKTRIKVSLPSSCPSQHILRQCFGMCELLRPT